MNSSEESAGDLTEKIKTSKGPPRAQQDAPQPFPNHRMTDDRGSSAANPRTDSGDGDPLDFPYTTMMQPAEEKKRTTESNGQPHEQHEQQPPEQYTKGGCVNENGHSSQSSNNNNEGDGERHTRRVAAVCNVDEGSDADSVRPGSSFKERRQRQRLVPSVSYDSIELAIASSNNSGDERKSRSTRDAHLRRCGSDLEDELGNNPSSLPLSTDECVQGAPGTALLFPHLGDVKDGCTESVADSMSSSPPVVTLWAVDRDLRRKRIKKVSHYILGPLLGEGSYGVVRDCIDLNTDNADRRFSRCAIKIISGNCGAYDTPAATPGQASGKPSFPAEDDKAHDSQRNRDAHGARNDDAAPLTVPAANALKRTTGIQYRRDEDLKRQETLQREMRNLQRFHSRNIIRALDTFTRYGKEYVVMPIAICSMQQLIEQLLRTRWHEAVRAWQQSPDSLQGVKCGEAAPSASSTRAPLPERFSWLSVPASTKGGPNLDDLTLTSDSEGIDVDEGDGSATEPLHRYSDESDDGRHHFGEAGINTSMSDSDRTRERRRRGVTASWGSQENSRAISHRSPRFASTEFFYSAPATHRMEDCSHFSYRWHPSELPQERRSGPPPAFAGEHRYSDGSCVQDNMSDGSSAGTVGSIAVMSATPPALCTAELPWKVDELDRNDPSCTGYNGPERELEVGAPPASSFAVRPDRPRVLLPLCSPTLLKGIVYQLISGVAYLHRQRLAHNDIKPSNILFFEDGTVKLADLGSVSDTYNDQGSALCASPELCKYFYGAATPPSSFSQSTESVGKDAAQPSDMWCCGLILYYLITGMPGPLPVHIRYMRSLRNKHAHPQLQIFSSHGAHHDWDGKSDYDGIVPPITTRYQLYREIAHQQTPIDLSDLPDIMPPDMGDDVLYPTMPTSNTRDALKGDAADDRDAMPTYPPNSVRHLLAGLLELDPRRRLTAEQALHHPWLRMAFRSKTNVMSSREHQDGEKRERKQKQRKPPSKQAMEDAIQRDVARRVMESRHVQHMLRLDQQRHLQFVADCCNMLNIAIPPEIIKAHPREPYHSDSGANTQCATFSVLKKLHHNALASRPGSTYAPERHNAPGRNEWSVTSCNSRSAGLTRAAPRDSTRPRVMPRGCVDTELFLPLSEEDYYEIKSGKTEFDVRGLRRKPLIVAQLQEYLHNVVLVQCGYRTGPDASYQAMCVRAFSEHDGSGRRRHSGGNGAHRGDTQQPAVVIMPGAGGSIHRCSRPDRLASIAAVSSPLSSPPPSPSLPTMRPDHVGTGGASNNSGLAEVSGCGPRHPPRAQTNNLRVGMATGPSNGVTALRLNSVTGRALIDTSLSGAAAAAAAEAEAQAASAAAQAAAPPGSCAPRVPRSDRPGNRKTVTGQDNRTRDASDSPSEEEVKVAMRESSKCLCGLV